MIIDRIEIISFGKFKNKTIDFSQGLNVIYGDNESGKSTVISFIYAMFYGFGDNRTKSLSLREKYTPWDGGVCEGRILVSADDGRHISIYRKAGSAKKYDILHVHDADTGEELSFSPEEIVALSGDTFLKTLCVRQLGTSFDGSNDEISQRLSNIASGGDEGVSFEKAQKILDSIRREIQPQRGSGGLYAEITKKLSDAQRAKSDQKTAISELSSLQKLISAEDIKVEDIKKELEALTKTDYSSSIAHISGRLEEMEKNSGKKNFIIPVIFLVIFIALVFINIKLSVIPLALFIASLFLVKGRKNSDTQKALTEEKESLIFKKAEAEKRISKLKDELEKANSRIMEMKIREKSLSAMAEQNDDMTALYSEKEFLEKKLRIVTLASRALSSAYENMQRNFTPALSKRASSYFEKLTGGKYSRIFCDNEFSLSIEQTIPRDSSFFSGGTVDQLYLSLRLALIDMIFGENPCPVILDQPFLQYDEERKKNALLLFENEKTKRQFIIFTADKNMAERNI